MKTINTEGITYIEPVPGGTAEWYCGISREHGDLYEAEEVYRCGEPVKGNQLCLLHYPDGSIYWPVPQKAGTYSDSPVYLDGCVYMLNVDFPRDIIRICCFDGAGHGVTTVKELPLSDVKDCYNLQLHTAPLTLTRQGGEGLFEIIWPERICFSMDPHESFFLREGERLYFSKWYEEGEGTDYRYWEETVIRNLAGDVAEVLPGDVHVMPDGELWHLR